MKKTAFLLALVFLLKPAFTAPSFDNPGLKVDQVFRSLQEPGEGPEIEEFTITEDEFNAWLRANTADKEYILDLKADFHDDNQVDFTMEMDLGRIEDGGYYPQMVATMFKGRQVLQAGGEILVENGYFTFMVNSLSINETIITPALIAPLISMLLPGYDLSKPLELPYGITDIRSSEGVLTITR